MREKNKELYVGYECGSPHISQLLLTDWLINVQWLQVHCETGAPDFVGEVDIAWLPSSKNTIINRE